MTKVVGTIRGIRVTAKKDSNVRYVEMSIQVPLKKETDLVDLVRHFQNESEFIIKSRQESLKV